MKILNRKLLLKTLFVTLLFIGIFGMRAPKAEAAAQLEGCFKSTGYVNTVVVVRIENWDGTLIKYSDSFSFNVEQFHPWPALAYPNSNGVPLDGVGQDADNNPFYNDGKRWVNNSREAPFSAKSGNFYVNKNYNSSSICNVYGTPATAQVFGDRFFDGHPYLACHYGNYGDSIAHSLGFRFTAGDNWDTDGYTGYWVNQVLEKRPNTPDEDTNDDSENIVFTWRRHRDQIPPHTRLVIDDAKCNNISGWAYDAFLASRNPWEAVQVHIYVDGGPGTSPYGGWPLTADQPRSDLTQASTGIAWWVDPPPGKGYGWSVNPQTSPLSGLDLTKWHTLNFYTPNVPVQNPFTGALIPGATQGSNLIATARMDPGPCPPKTDFDTTITGSTTFDDDESPHYANLNGTVKIDRDVNGFDIKCEFYVKGGASLGSDNRTGVNLDSSTEYKCGQNGVDVSGAGLVVGSEVCLKVTVNPGSGNADASNAITTPVASWIPKSEEFCATKVNKPFTKVFGGDVRAGVGYAAPCAVASSDIKGFKGVNNNSSGVQLAAFASGVVHKNADQFASATQRASSPTAPAGLTFANTGSSLGGFAYTNCLPNFFNESAGMTAIAPGSVTLNSATQTQKANATYTTPTSATTIGPGIRQTIYVDGDLIVKGNIGYSAFANIGQIPSLRFVVKGDIFIDKAVDSLAGWYIAQPWDDGGTTKGGNIYTCANGSTPVTAANVWSECATKLTVNGAFTAANVKLLRSKNSLRDEPLSANRGGASAEEFVFSPEQWLVAPPRYDISGGAPSAPLHYITSLPPVL